jgi:hypothetical protein
MGVGSWEFFQGPLTRHQVQLSIFFGGIGFFAMEDYASFVFLRSRALMALYLCVRFYVFDRPILKEYVS